MQKFIFTGNLTADVELKNVANDKVVANFSVAVERPHSEETDFFNVEVWGKQAENCDKYLKKGSKVLVVGYIKTRSYEDKDSVKRKVWEVNAEQVEFLSSKPQQQEEQQAQYRSYEDKDGIKRYVADIIANENKLPF